MPSSIGEVRTAHSTVYCSALWPAAMAVSRPTSGDCLVSATSYKQRRFGLLRAISADAASAAAGRPRILRSAGTTAAEHERPSLSPASSFEFSKPTLLASYLAPSLRTNHITLSGAIAPSGVVGLGSASVAIPAVTSERSVLPSSSHDSSAITSSS